MTWKKKLIYQSWHRGTKEADLFLGPFADQFVHQFNEEQLRQYERIIDIPDQVLVPILYGQKTADQEYNSEVMRILIKFINEKN